MNFSTLALSALLAVPVGSVIIYGLVTYSQELVSLALAPFNFGTKKKRF